MSYLSKDTILFLEKLSKNNKREWFHKNKKNYENNVREPFKKLVEEIIFRLGEIEPDFHSSPKEAIFRINRDLRFTKDKTPYKTHISASFKNGGRTSPNQPGYYIQISPKNIMLGGGVCDS